MSLGPLDCDSFSHFLVSDDLDNSEDHWLGIQYFVECPSTGICLMFFSWLEWILLIFTLIEIICVQSLKRLISTNRCIMEKQSSGLSLITHTPQSTLLQQFWLFSGICCHISKSYADLAFLDWPVWTLAPNFLLFMTHADCALFKFPSSSPPLRFVLDVFPQPFQTHSDLYGPHQWALLL